MRGSSLAGIATWGLLIEAGTSDPAVRARPGFRILNLMLSGALLLGLSDLQAEFDFGAPSFSLGCHPLLVAVAASCSLVAARVAIGPGGSLAAVVSYVSLRASVAVFVGGMFDHTATLFPLYLGSAVLVEVIAVVGLRRQRGLAWGAGVGAVVGTVGLRPTGDPTTRTAEIALDPADAADDARWFMVYAFRGGGQRIVPLERVGPGGYGSTDAFPVGDDWNTLIRLHVGRQMLALPISQPYDEAIPAPPVEPEDGVTRTFVADRDVVQRESVDLDAGAERVAYAICAVLSAAMLWVLVLELRRLRQPGAPRPDPEPVLEPEPA